MSVKNLTDKMTNLDAIAVPPRPAMRERNPVTAPGQLAQFSSAVEEKEREIKTLTHRLEQFQDGLPTLLLDPSVIRASRWANRIPDAFTQKAFEDLKFDIEASGGNVQPVKVRPLPNEEGRFELVFGHRRHRACLELGLKVLALIDESLDDRDLFAQMDRENRGREDLSPYETGLAYAQALDSGLFKHQKDLCQTLGVDQGVVSRVLTLARLPPVILDAFPSRLAMQMNWAGPLMDLVTSDADRLNERLLTLPPLKSRTPAGVYNHLLGVASDQMREIRLAGRKVASVALKEGVLRIQVGRGVLNSTQAGDLERMVAEFIESAIKAD